MRNILVSYLSVHLHQTLVKMKGRTVGDTGTRPNKEDQACFVVVRTGTTLCPSRSQYQQQKDVAFFTIIVSMQ
jgi:hypothetical protein